MNMDSTSSNPKLTENKPNLSTLFPLMGFLSLNPKLNNSKPTEEVHKKIPTRSIK